tara:strand:+ start:1760 stop:2095 length:336 start_codon:yes stop_codon:yes gene_type:complete
MEDMPASSPFNVPDGFFDDQRQRIRQRLKENDKSASRFNQPARRSWMRAAAFWIGIIGVVVSVQQWNAHSACETYACLLEQQEPSLTVSDDMLEEWLDDGALFDDILLDDV